MKVSNSTHCFKKALNLLDRPLEGLGSIEQSGLGRLLQSEKQDPFLECSDITFIILLLQWLRQGIGVIC